MPCDTIQKSTIEFGPKTNLTYLAKALESLGWKRQELTDTTLRFTGPQYSTAVFRDGALTITGRTAVEENPIKRAYSTEVVKAASTRFGWTSKQTGDHQFQVTRRF